MQAQQEKPAIRPTTGLLAAGNANDHFHTLHQDDLVKLIESKQAQTIDILKLVIETGGTTTTRYAHSYIGLGLTPQVGLELNKTKLNKLNEMWICVKAIVSLRPVQLHIDGRTETYSSLIFSNIDRMAKYLTLSKNSSINDGKFEVVSFRFINKFRLVSALLKASTVGLNSEQHEDHIAFTTIKPTAFQVDGEILDVDTNAAVTITAEHRALRCII
jgi:diacylglycerol kinase family enzyme